MSHSGSVNHPTRQAGVEQTHGEHDEYDHERPLGDRAWTVVLVLGKEEERAEAYLLHIESDKDVLHGLGVEQPTGIRRGWLLVRIQE